MWLDSFGVSGRKLSFCELWSWIEQCESLFDLLKRTIHFEKWHKMSAASLHHHGVQLHSLLKHWQLWIKSHITSNIETGLVLLPSPGFEVHLLFRSQILHIIIITWLQCRSKTTYCNFYTVLTTGFITMKSGTVIISMPMSKSQQVTWQKLQECSVLWCVPASWCYFRVTLTDQIDTSSGASLDGLCTCAHVR